MTWNLVQFALVAIVLAACSGKGNGGGNCDAYGGCNPSVTAGAPTVKIGAVPQTAKGAVTLTATIPSAANGVTKVEFLVDNVLIGTAVSNGATPPTYSISWESTNVVDGGHDVEARLTDAKGLVAFDTAPVIVANAITLTMSPVEEGPAVTGTVVTGTGTFNANLFMNPPVPGLIAAGAITGSITISNMKDAGGAPVLPTAAHIHQGYAGNAGTVIIPFVNTSNTYFCGAAACTAAQTLTGTNPQIPPAAAPTFSATVTNITSVWGPAAGATLTAAQASALRAGGLYVNAHSARFPAGELRTQIKPPNIRTVFTNMTGGQETPPNASAGTGFAAVTVDSAASTASFHITTTGVTGVAAHIHTGAAGVAGPILVPSGPTGSPDPANAAHWFAEAVPVTAADITNFANSGWYVNVHSAAFPGGEVRGQVTSSMFTAALNSANETPPTLGIVYTAAVTVTYDPVTLETCVRGSYAIPTTVFDTVTLSHIHTGGPGVAGAVVQNYGTNIGNTCQTTTAAIFNPIIANPTLFYYNIHTTTFPAGAMRGQLVKAP